MVNDLCPLTAPALRFEVDIGLQVDFPLVQIGFNLYKSRALPVQRVLAVIYKTVSDFIHFSARVRKSLMEERYQCGTFLHHPTLYEDFFPFHI